MAWQMDGKNFIYELNSDGVNRWWAQVNAGYNNFSDGGGRPSTEEIEKITQLMLTAPELLEALRYARRMVKASECDVVYIDAVIQKAQGEPK